MFGLPFETKIFKQVPKVELFKHAGLDSRQKRLFDKTISRMALLNAITPTTVHALTEGSTVKSIFVLKVQLNEQKYNPELIALIAKGIAQTLILALSYEDKVQMAVFMEQLIVSPWMESDDYKLQLIGSDFDVIWLNIVRDLSKIEADSLESLKKKIQKNMRISELEERINSLDKQCRNERQSYYKQKLFDQLQELKVQLFKEINNE